MSKSPAFQFYPGDWLSSFRIAEMTLEEEGAYIRLLCYCWSEGSIPRDPDRCARIIGKGCSTTVATNVQRTFNEHPNDKTLLVHDRLEQERDKQTKRREQASAAGKSSAAKRKQNTKKTGVINNEGQRPLNSRCNERSTNVQRKTNPSSSSSSSSSNITTSRNSFADSDMQTAAFIAGLLNELQPNRKPPNLESWANDVRLMRERDKRTDAQIREVFAWANNDEFWQVNILSPAKLREKFDQLVLKKGKSIGSFNRQKPDTRVDGSADAEQFESRTMSADEFLAG